MTKPIQITTNELLDALRQTKAPECPADAMTIEELAKALGMGLTSTKARVRRLQADGQVAAWKKQKVDANGRHYLAAAYTMLPAKRKVK